MRDFKTIFRFLIPYKGQVSLSMLCHVLMAVFTIISIPLVIPFFHFLFSTVPEVAGKPDSLFDMIGWLEYYFVGAINEYGVQKALLFTCGFLVLTFFLKNLFRYLAMYFMIPVRSNIVNSIRGQLYDSYLHSSFDSKQQHTRGDLIARMTADVQEVEWSILRFIQTIFKSPIIILGSVFLMLSINPVLTMFVFGLMIFTLLVIGTLSKSLKKSSSGLQNTVSQLTSKVDETLDGSLLLKVFRVEEQWKKAFTSTNQEHKRLYDQVTRRQELSSPLSEFLGVTVVVVLLWYGAQLVFDKSIRPEAFFAFVFAFYHVIEPLKSFSTAFYNIKKGSASLDRIDALLTKNDSIPSGGHNKFVFDKEIVFDKVAFSYEDNKVLDNISFTISKGESLAIVGDSGAGKSTIVSLLLGIISPTSGRITVDEKKLESIDKTDLYKQVGIVTQTPFLFNDTIENNVTMGREGITASALDKSLSLANASDFVTELPDQLQTTIGDRGEQLSGGERQRLTIARALLENPELLILDEPTSSLDPGSEHKVSTAITEAVQGRTAIIIAHRLSTIRYASRILFLSAGKIVQSGSHEELIRNEGRYKEYVELQTL